MKKGLLIIGLIFSIISCVKTIDVDGINKDKRLYVFSNIDNINDSCRLYFGISSLNYLNKPKTLELEIKYNNDIVNYSLRRDSYMLIASIPNLHFKGGELLSIKALADGKYRAESQIVIPDAPMISSSSVNRSGVWSISFKNDADFKKNYYLISKFLYTCEFKQSDSLPYSAFFTPTDIFGLVINPDSKSKDNESEFSIDFSNGRNYTIPIFNGIEIRNGNTFNGVIYRDLGLSYDSQNDYKNIKSIVSEGRVCTIPLTTFNFLRKYDNLKNPVDMFMGILFNESSVFPSNIKYGIGIINVYNFNIFPVELDLDDFKSIVGNFYHTEKYRFPLSDQPVIGNNADSDSGNADNGAANNGSVNGNNSNNN